MNIATKLTYCLLIFGFAGCASISSGPAGLASLETAESLPPGTARERVVQVLGNPDKIIPSKTASAGVAWLYLSNLDQDTRLSFRFAPGDLGKVVATSWFARESERESDLEYIKDRYKTAIFELIQPLPRELHYVADEVYYLDHRIGLRVSYGKAHQKVESVSWLPPENRSMAGTPEDK